MELVRGAVADRPWGATLAALARRALTGQLTLTAEDGKRYSILFERGAVVNASSPQASDAVARIALTQGLISSTQVSELVRHLAKAHYPDEIEALAKAARLTTDQLKRLRRQVIAQRAARTFSIDRGTFIVDDVPTILPVDGAELDVRAVIYLGSRVNLSEARLAEDLRAFGTRFTLDTDRAGDLPYFGFTEGEQAIVDSLARGASVVELVATHTGHAPRTAHAVVYALAACNAVKSLGRSITETTSPPRSKATVPPTSSSETALPRTTTNVTPRAHATTGADTGAPRTRAATGSDGAPSARASTESSGPRVTPVALAGAADPLTIRFRPSTTMPPDVEPPAAAPPPPLTTPLPTPPPRAVTDTSPSLRRATGQQRVVSAPRAVTTGQHGAIPDPPARPTTGQQAVVLDRATTTGQQAAVTEPDPPPSRARTTSSPVPSRTQTPPSTPRAPTGPVPARTPTDPTMPRTPTDPAVARTATPVPRSRTSTGQSGEAPVASRTITDPLAARSTSDANEAKEAFRRGEMAMRRDQFALAMTEFSRAKELAPKEPDYDAMFAWAKFCDAINKHSVAAEVRKALESASRRSEKPILATFYLGRVERMLGRDKEALARFQDVLEMQPQHKEATSEIRVLESRIRAGKGLFSKR